MSGVADRLPSWRRPIGVLSSSDLGSAVRLGLRGAILDLLESGPMTFAELSAAILDQWGDATPNQIGGRVGSLIQDGYICRDGRQYLVSPDE